MSHKSGRLDRANEIRVARAKLRREVKLGRTSIYTLVADPPPEIAGMAVVKLIAWHPGVARTRAENLLRHFDAPHMAVGRMGPRLRADLLDRMHEGVNGVRALQ